MTETHVMKQTILIVEDEPSIAELIAVNLEHQGYEVIKTSQVLEASAYLKKALPHLIILDWMLPGKSGVQYAQDLRAQSETAFIPIMMLTAKSEEADKILGLDFGADDYMTKPFSVKEFLARVKALLRRQSPLTSDQEIFTVGPITLNLVSHQVSAKSKDASFNPIILGPTEFRLLHFLMSKPERVHTRSSLLDQVWGSEAFIEERTVDVHIKRLRAALTPSNCDTCIETVRGVGYRITATPQKGV